MPDFQRCWIPAETKGKCFWFCAALLKIKFAVLTVHVNNRHPGAVERHGNKVEGHRINTEQKLDKSGSRQAFKEKRYFPLHIS